MILKSKGNGYLPKKETYKSTYGVKRNHGEKTGITRPLPDGGVIMSV